MERCIYTIVRYALQVETVKAELMNPRDDKFEQKEREGKIIKRSRGKKKKGMSQARVSVNKLSVLKAALEAEESTWAGERRKII